MHLISFLGEAIVGSLNWDAREIAEEVFSGNASIDQFHIFQISNFKEKQALISFKFPVFHCSSEGFSQSLIVSIVIFSIRSICAMGANAKYTIGGLYNEYKGTRSNGHWSSRKLRKMISSE